MIKTGLLEKIGLSWILLLLSLVLFAMSFYNSLPVLTKLKAYTILPMLWSLSYVSLASLGYVQIKVSNLFVISLLFFGLWLAYNLLGSLWFISVLTITGSAASIFYFGCYYFAAYYLGLKLPNKLIIIMIMLVVLSYFIFAGWEISTGQHLSTSRLYNTSIPIPTGPFFNENNLCAMLMLLIPYLQCYGRGRYVFVKELLGFISSLIILVICFICGARLAIIGAGAFVVFYTIRYHRIQMRLAVILLLIVATWYAAHKYTLYYNMAKKVAATQFETIGQENSSNTLSSIKIRIELSKKAIQMAQESFFMGVGGNSFLLRMERENIIETAGVLAPHNYFLAILAEGGVFCFLLVLMFYLSHLRRTWQLLGNNSFSMASFYALLLFLPTSVLPSSLSVMLGHWSVFGLIAGATTRLDNQWPSQEN